MLSQEMRQFYVDSVVKYKSLEPTDDMMEMAARSAALVSVASGNRELDDDDFQGCMAQLCYAATKFKPEKGVKWSTYAVNVAQRFFIEQYHRSMRRKHDQSRLVKSAYTGDGKHLLDGMVDSRSPDAEKITEKRDSIRALLGHLKCLSAREIEIIHLRFGLGGGEPWTLHEIAERQGCSKERIRQIEVQALNKLREKLTICLNKGR